MSSSDKTTNTSTTNTSTTNTSNNTVNDPNAKLCCNVCNAITSRKDELLHGINSEWVKVTPGCSVKLKKGRPVLESTFRLD